MKKSAAPVITLLFLSASISSCSTQPSPIKLGIDNCSSCSMTITNPRFGVEAITKKGKIYKYDEIGCLLSHLEDGGLLRSDIKEIYTPDFSNKNELINIENSHLLKSDALRSPMGSNIAAFAQEDSLQNFVAQFGGEKITWMSLYK
jgi:copper chaperone NosL